MGASLSLMKSIVAPCCPLNEAFNVYMASELQRPILFAFSFIYCQIFSQQARLELIKFDDYFNFLKILLSKFWTFIYVAALLGILPLYFSG